MFAIFMNWKTTLAGAGAALTAAGHLVSHIAAGDTSTIMADVPLIIAGVGLMFGADARGK